MSSTIARQASPFTKTVALIVLPMLVGIGAQAAAMDVGPAALKKAPAKTSVRTVDANRHPSDSRQAIAHYFKILAKTPNNANALIGRGKAYVSSHDYVLALADYNHAIQVAPQSNAARYGHNAVLLLMQEQAARSLAAAKPAKNSGAPVLDGSQFDGDGTIRAHVPPSAPTLAGN